MARQPTLLRPAGVPTKREPDVSSKRYVRPDEERPAFVRQLEADGHAGLPVQREQLQKFREEMAGQILRVSLLRLKQQRVREIQLVMQNVIGEYNTQVLL